MDYQAQQRGPDRLLVWLNPYTAALALCVVACVLGLYAFMSDGNPTAALVAFAMAAASFGLFFAAREYIAGRLERICAKCHRVFSRHSHPGSGTHLCAWCFGRLRS